MESKESNNTETDSEPIKIILIGDSGTGKTNLITVSAGYEFNSNALTTRACSFIQKTFIKNNKEVKVNIWDTIGQEKYRSLTKIFVKE
jgi:small GTP-binding protein